MIRRSSPSFVQTLWDGIERFNLSPLNKLTVYLQRKLNISEEEILVELQRTKEDNLVVSFAAQNNGHGNGNESDLYGPPDPEEFMDNRGEHDWYCFHCHLGGRNGCIVYCSTCPRIYHAACLNLNVQIGNQTFTCPACKICDLSSAQLNISLEDVNNFISYSCSKLYKQRNPKLNKADGLSWAKESGRDIAKNAWRYDTLIYSSIDLSMILRKAKEFSYTSLEEYEKDCRTLVHNVAVYFGSTSVNRLNSTGKLLESVLDDIKEIRLCPDCFRHSNELKPDWFALPCSNPHQVVWAGLNKCLRAAKVIQRDISTGIYDVRYFGGKHERAKVTSKNVVPIETSPSLFSIKDKAEWNQACKELQKFQKLASAAGKQLPGIDTHGLSTLANVSVAPNKVLTAGCVPPVLEEQNKDATVTTDGKNTTNCEIMPTDSPQSPKRQAGCLAGTSDEVDGAGPPLWDAYSPIDLALEELSDEYKVVVLEEDSSDTPVTDGIQDANSNNFKDVIAECDPSAPEEPARFGIPCTANDEVLGNDDSIITIDTTSDEEDPLALGSADETRASTKENPTGFLTEESNRADASIQCNIMESSITEGTGSAQLFLEELQNCESVDGTGLAIIRMILEKRKGCECAGCQSWKLQIGNGKMPKT